jgi:hypothetical protein
MNAHERAREKAVIRNEIWKMLYAADIRFSEAGIFNSMLAKLTLFELRILHQLIERLIQRGDKK